MTQSQPLHAQRQGTAKGTPVLLIPGLGQQHLAWPQSIVDALSDHYPIVAVDNRDTGLSPTTVGALPNLLQLRADHEQGQVSGVAYTLETMAGDVVATMDALEIASCHAVGFSLGGMIAQVLAANYPDRVASLTSISSSVKPPEGDRGVTGELLMGAAPDASPADLGRRQAALLGGPHTDLDHAAEVATAAHGRAHNPAGMVHQLAAIWASGDRTEDVSRITAPSLVLHGDLDRFVGPENGHETAAALGLTLSLLPEIGHEIPTAPERIVPHLLRHLADADGRA